MNEMERLVLDDDFIEALDKGEVSNETLAEIERIIKEGAIGETTVDDVQPTPFITEAAEYTHKLGRHKLPNQTRLHWHGPSDIRFETRSQSIEVFVTFRHPTMSDFVNHAVSCLAAASVASAVTAAATNSPNAGIAIFKPGWKACMVAKVGATIANQIQVKLSTKTVTGTWSGH